MSGKLRRVVSASVVALATAVTAFVVPEADVVLAAGTIYYVDCVDGNDNDNGTSQGNAWKSLSKANGETLAPGDSLLLKRGCSWNGPLMASWNGTADSPILIGAYGSGDHPLIKNAPDANVKISGSYMVIENLQTHTDTGQYTLDAFCLDQPVGWKLGFQFDGPAHHNIVRSSRTSNHAMGFGFSDLSHHNVVTNNEIRDNVALWRNGPGDPLGGTGINLHGDGNEVSWNTFSNNKCYCARLSDGSASALGSSISIELFTATNSIVSHNLSSDRVFVELGSSATSAAADNSFAYNVHSNSEQKARFVVTRGSGVQYGPVLRTSLYNNVVYSDGPDSQGVVCIACSPDVLTMRNNIITVITKALHVSAGNTFNESNNIYWPTNGLPLPNNFIQNWNIDPSSRVANPRFVNPPERDFHVTADSPAVDAGSAETLDRGFTQDLDGEPVPASAAADIGVDEFAGAPTRATDLPQVTAPVYAITAFQLNPDSVPMPVSWTGTDRDGISLYELQMSTNGGEFTTVKSIRSATDSQSTALNLPAWNTYQLQVRAIDSLGTVGTWATGPAFTINLHHESAPSIGYSGSWATDALSGAYDGSVRYAEARGSNATITFTGTSVTWVSTRGPNRGKAEVWLDGVKQQTVDLYVSSGQMTPRRVVFTASGLEPNVAHTLEIRVLGAKHANSTSMRVDLDAIVVLQ